MKLWLAAACVLLTGCAASALPPLPTPVPGTVTGTVIIAPCQPVQQVGSPPCPPRPGIRVHLDGPSAGATAITGPTGTYVAELPPGTYQVWAEGGIVRPAPVTVTVVSGQTVTLNLTVDSGIR